jgi:hypothetical protein
MKGHQLYKQVSGLNASIVITAGSVDGVTIIGAEGWEYIPQSATYVGLANRTSIDLAGWSMQELTMFTVGVDVQKDKAPLSIPATATPVVWCYDLLTTRRISNNELSNILAEPPGFLPSTLDLMQVIYGELQTFAENQQVPGTYITTGNTTFGSGTPNAMDKLHWTRFYLLASNANTNFTISPTNLVVQATTDQEKDLVYMERLRRSYVTQGRNT